MVTLSYVQAANKKGWWVINQISFASVNGLQYEEMIAAVVETMTLLTRMKREDVWMCDFGASNHLMWSKKGARNEGASGSVSIGHTG